MKLGGQSENGYAMAVLLVALSVMAVMLTVAMPTWKQMTRREKEAELVFRGEQYARAIGLFQRKYANTPPPDLDVLVRERFLRKKFKDPITNADFVPIPAGGQATPAGLPGAGPTGAPPTGRGGGPITAGPLAPGAVGGRGGIIGVTSASKDESIRIYNGATHYNEWRFVFVQTTTTPGAVPGGRGAPGPVAPGRGGRGAPPPGTGGFPFPAGRGPGGAGPAPPTRGGGPLGGPTPPPAPGRGR
jgi:type II secretory pathway pseudopilin PulG